MKLVPAAFRVPVNANTAPDPSVNVPLMLVPLIVPDTDCVMDPVQLPITASVTLVLVEKIAVWFDTEEKLFEPDACVRLVSTKVNGRAIDG